MEMRREELWPAVVPSVVLVECLTGDARRDAGTNRLLRTCIVQRELTTEGGTWVANFQPGLGGIELGKPHPNGRDAVVVAAGDLWVVEPARRSAELLLPAIDAALEVRNPDGWILSRQGIALARFG